MSGGGRSPAQTIGPFFAFALPAREESSVVRPETPGAVVIGGQLLDGKGDPITDGLIETWQIDPPGTRGFGRAATNGEGRYAIVTLKPRATRTDDGTVHAPHLAVSVFARGLLKRAVTRIYFSDEAAANASDPVLRAVADEAARATLISARDLGGYRFDIRMQGQGETVFFDV